MDEKNMDTVISSTNEGDITLEMRDENRSPTSGSSSEAYADGGAPTVRRNRKRNRNPRPKRKRKWKPYSELTWDEKKVVDDWESRRALAKRERLSAEGHPIAPYNTTQFLMDDRKLQSNNVGDLGRLGTLGQTATDKLPTDDNCNNYNNASSKNVTADFCKDETKRNAEEVVDVDKQQSCDKKRTVDLSDASTDKNELKRIGSNNALFLSDRRQLSASMSNSPFTLEVSAAVDSQSGEDIQKYILDDFSHTYADIHAEHLQAMSKADLVEECLKLEKKVDALERRVKDCRRKHKIDQNKSRSEMHLLERINLLQAVNAQLQKENSAAMGDSEEYEVSKVPVSDCGPGAPIDVTAD